MIARTRCVVSFPYVQSLFFVRSRHQVEVSGASHIDTMYDPAVRLGGRNIFLALVAGAMFAGWRMGGTTGALQVLAMIAVVSGFRMLTTRLFSWLFKAKD